MAGRSVKDYGGMPHSSDMSMKSKTHVKHYSSADGSGGIRDYSDTSELVKRDQEMGNKQIKKQPMKPGHRY